MLFSDAVCNPYASIRSVVITHGHPALVMIAIRFHVGAACREKYISVVKKDSISLTRIVLVCVHIASSTASSPAIDHVCDCMACCADSERQGLRRIMGRVVCIQLSKSIICLPSLISSRYSQIGPWRSVFSCRYSRK